MEGKGKIIKVPTKFKKEQTFVLNKYANGPSTLINKYSVAD